MNKKLLFIFIALFLSIQIYSSMHMAQHGFEEHKHHGYICNIYLSYQSHKFADIPAIHFETLSHFVFLVLTALSCMLVAQKIPAIYRSRAPPIILL